MYAQPPVLVNLFSEVCGTAGCSSRRPSRHRQSFPPGVNVTECGSSNFWERGKLRTNPLSAVAWSSFPSETFPKHATEAVIKHSGILIPKEFDTAPSEKTTFSRTQTPLDYYRLNARSKFRTNSPSNLSYSRHPRHPTFHSLSHLNRPVHPPSKFKSSHQRRQTAPSPVSRTNSTSTSVEDLGR